MKEHFGKFDVYNCVPSEWIKKFEQCVRLVCREENEFDLEAFFLLICYIFSVRESDELWSILKRTKFVPHFWKKYWKFAEKALNSETETGESFREFTCDKIARLKRLFPGIPDKATITLCLLDFPESCRAKLQEGIVETLEMFVCMVDALDKHIGEPSPKSGDQESDDQESDDQERDDQVPDVDKEVVSNKVQKIIADKVEEMEERQVSKLEEMISKAFSDDRIKSLIQNVFDK